MHSGRQAERSFRLENVRRLTHDTRWWETHGFTPDGRAVLTTNTRAGWQSSDLYLVDVETGARTRLTDDLSWDEHGHFSPDGRKISWISARWRKAGMLRMTDGSLSPALDWFVARRLSIGGVDYTVIGVMPRDFHLPTAETGLWRPLSSASQWWRANQNARDGDGLEVLGRLAAGASIEDGRAEMKTIGARLREEYVQNRDVDVTVEELRLPFRSARELFADPMLRVVAMPEWRWVCGMQPGDEQVLAEAERALETYFASGPLSLTVKAGIAEARKP